MKPQTHRPVGGCLASGFVRDQEETSVKKLINRPETVVEDMVQGLVAMYPSLARLSQHSALVRADAEQVRDYR